MEPSVSESRNQINQVDNWVKEAGRGLTAEQLVDLAEMATDALWKRAYLTLGAATVAAVMDRVLFTASENFPPFKSLQLAPMGIDWQGLRKQHQSLNERELAEGTQFVITEFMKVVGNLTADILRPALQTELSKVKLERPKKGGKQEDGQS
jgi:hypothetical protein